MLMNIKARALKAGDRIGLAAPSNRPASAAELHRSCKIVEEMGFIPVVGQNVLKTFGPMAGTDEERLADLNRFFFDDSIAGIFCLSGGWGSLRLLPHFDFTQISKNPKVIVGSDDNCSLLLALHKMTGLVTFCGMNLNQIIHKQDFEKFKTNLTTNSTWTALESKISHYPVVKGSASGYICASNLIALVSLFGTPFEPDLSEHLLILEDIDEQYTALDRNFTTLYLAGVLQKINAIGFGHFYNCGAKGAENMLPVEDTFGDQLKLLNKKACFGLPFGQTNPSSIIPVGIKGTLDCTNGVLQFNEPSLS
ncbi:MAG: LD-carboxypeptidase [Candidatus Obscuribacterales bacterium]|nr:LD-carboxypeptidase [Candidatus Obscuribacterales bacterium]